MSIITLEELSKDHLAEYWHICAVGPSRDYALEVWNSRRLLPFLGADAPGTLIKTLYVAVTDFTNEGLQPLMQKLSVLDSSAEQHRLNLACSG